MAKQRNTLAYWLRQARKDASLTQEQAAERANLHAVSISQLERGVRQPRPETLRSLAGVYGRPIEWFYGASEETALLDADLRRFFREEWGEMTEDEQALVKTAVRMAREAKRLREARS